MAKITRSTVKSFIKKNADKLLIDVKSSFDGMVDGCVSHHEGFTKTLPADKFYENNLGIQGAWFVGQSRDYFSEYNENGLEGIKVYNSCGSFILAVPK